MVSHTSSLLVLAVLTLVKSATIIVKVADTGLEFNPSSITAAVGDQIEFQFVHGGHAVTQGTFSNACQPSGATAFNSGYVSQSGGNPWTITINSTDPIYYYCPVSDHCQEGMAGAINAPDSQSAADYITAAKNSKSSNEPQNVQGGVFASASSQGSTSSATSTSSQSAASASSTSGTATSGGATSSSATSGQAGMSSSTTGTASSSSKPATANGAAAAIHPPAFIAVPLLLLAAFQL